LIFGQTYCCHKNCANPTTRPTIYITMNNTKVARGSPGLPTQDDTQTNPSADPLPLSGQYNPVPSGQV
jgi:hypothetical protein